MILCFQPHLQPNPRFRGRIFLEVMSQADEVLLLPIYPARELPIDASNAAAWADASINEAVFL